MKKERLAFVMVAVIFVELLLFHMKKMKLSGWRSGNDRPNDMGKAFNMRSQGESCKTGDGSNFDNIVPAGLGARNLYLQMWFSEIGQPG